MIPIFFFTDFDILFMSLLVCFQNFWVAWRQLDGDDSYSWAQFYKDEMSR